ncbi:FkbM family methyltransferase [Clostridioides difficile]|nr:FkbM family methyltransferase [Clostridioides difficile]
MDKNYRENMIKILKSYKNEKVFSKIEEIKNKTIYLYGAGNAGRLTHGILNKYDIDIKGFIDINAKKINNHMVKPVFSMDEIEFNDNTLIIVCVSSDKIQFDSIVSYINSFGVKDIMYFHICNLLLNIIKNKNLECDIEKIMTVLDFFEDDESKEVYSHFFHLITSLDYNDIMTPTEQMQYFLNDVSLSKGYNRFIDCGSFDGDTCKMLKKEKGIIEALVCFEPEPSNLVNLLKYLNNNKVSENQIVFPCGVHNKTKMIRFSSGCKSSSYVSSDGDTYIQCVAIDDVIKDFKPTFIKMDIEGSEYDALLGAEETIRKYTPDLAISVYHNVEHIYDIPLLIKSFNKNYKFYLRSHALFGAETVLYAYCE